MKKYFAGGVMKKIVNFVNNNDHIPIKFEYENKTTFEPGRRMVMISNHSGWFALDGMIAGELVWDDLYKCYLESTGKEYEDDGRKIFSAVVHTALKESPVAKLFPKTMKKEAMISRKEYRTLLRSGNYQDLPYYTAIFPESEVGSTKSFLQAYKLKEFKTGFIHNALLSNSDICISTVVGNEELLPSLCSIRIENQTMGTKLIVPFPMFPLMFNPFAKKSINSEQSYKLTVHDIVSIESIRERIDNGETHQEIAEWFRQKMQQELDKETFHRPLRVTSKFLDKFRSKAAELIDVSVNVKF